MLVYKDIIQIKKKYVQKSSLLNKLYFSIINYNSKKNYI